MKLSEPTISTTSTVVSMLFSVGASGSIRTFSGRIPNSTSVVLASSDWSRRLLTS